MFHVHFLQGAASLLVFWHFSLCRRADEASLRHAEMAIMVMESHVLLFPSASFRALGRTGENFWRP
jgi:hypothetical protein